MYTQQVEQSFKLLRENGIFITRGLTAAEIDAAEKRYNFKFPNDYKALLIQGMPLYDYDFTDWRNLSDEYVEYIQYKMFDETISGIFVLHR
ncbi:SMI1/KNR4 family protein [Escherichia sp. E4208]|uniref:SMI1/KNR4 family protein n=1 Tax=Escherichia sp. E4208 TaxID=2044463 RepID=UPI001F1041EF|nr:SMI1/KNR4 family protein [Escherichia sp. E4208]